MKFANACLRNELIKSDRAYSELGELIELQKQLMDAQKNERW